MVCNVVVLVCVIREPYLYDYCSDFQTNKQKPARYPANFTTEREYRSTVLRNNLPYRCGSKKEPSLREGEMSNAALTANRLSFLSPSWQINSIRPRKVSPLPSLSSPFTVNCRNGFSSKGDDPPLTTSSAYFVLGVKPSCSAAELKAAFRAKVKQFHPDVKRKNRDGDEDESDLIIRRVIQAYEMLSNHSRSEIIESECLDPFDNPECEAYDVFVNQVLCLGRDCPYSCVKQAPHAFAFSSSGTAQATCQDHGDDYQVQLAIGQCPRSCIHYVTPSQRIILEELLDSILDTPWDTSAEADLLYSLIVKAKYENNRYQKPKKTRQAKATNRHVDWF